MGYTINDAICQECGSPLLDTGRFLECDECGCVMEKTNEKLIESIRKEYPDAVITETDDKIIVDIQIVLEQPVKQIKLTGVVNR